MRCDIAVIGAGPAGLAAARAARGRSVVVVDMATRPGGQYFRHQRGRPSPALTRLLGDTRVLTEHRVVAIEPGVLHLSGVTRTLRADAILIATGAHDRPLPFPGWDLPGVMTAGGAQALYKGSGVVPGRRIVVAGTGPFLLPVAASLAPHVVGVFDANSPAGFRRHPTIVLTHPAKLVEAAGYLATLARHRVPFRTHHAVVAAHGTDQLTAVTIAGPRGSRRIECDTLAIGYGFVPQTDLVPGVVDDHQMTTVPGIYAAGETTGIAGVASAIVTGTIAGRAMAGLPVGRRLTRARARHAAFAAAMADVWPTPTTWLDNLTDDTLLCRCEEVRYAAVRDAVNELGARDARAVKLMTRTGMGWCQARMCGEAVACVVAHLTGTVADPTALARRTLAQPVTLGELATIEEDS